LGQEITFSEWHELELQRWSARQNDPDVIDSIGIRETVQLSTARFEETVGDYLSFWASSTTGESSIAEQWFDALQRSVVDEVAGVWQQTPWHGMWFERACRSKVFEALNPAAKQWKHRAARLEIQHLENPYLSIVSLHIANGDLKLAQLTQTNQVMADAKRSLAGSNSSQGEVTDTGRPLSASCGAAVAVPPVQPSKMEALEISGSATDQVAESATSFTPLIDFATATGRAKCLEDYIKRWGGCSEASLARAAGVAPADLSNWKAVRLPVDSVKAERIENVLKNNTRPITVNRPIEP